MRKEYLESKELDSTHFSISKEDNDLPTKNKSVVSCWETEGYFSVFGVHDM